MAPVAGVDDGSSPAILARRRPSGSTLSPSASIGAVTDTPSRLPAIRNDPAAGSGDAPAVDGARTSRDWPASCESIAAKGSAVRHGRMASRGGTGAAGSNDIATRSRIHPPRQRARKRSAAASCPARGPEALIIIGHAPFASERHHCPNVRFFPTRPDPNAAAAHKGKRRVARPAWL